jgi:hypothetical protein
MAEGAPWLWLRFEHESTLNRVAILGWAFRDTSHGIRPCALSRANIVTSEHCIEVCGAHASKIAKRGAAKVVVVQRWANPRLRPV